MKNASLEWRCVDSKRRVKFLNVVSNKRKLFKNSNYNEDDFFSEFVKFQKEMVKENHMANEINLDRKVKFLGEENLQIENSAMYCSFRLGAFMLIPLMLLKKKVDVIVLVSKSSYNKTINLLKENGLQDKLEIIIINEPLGFRKVIKESKKGKSFFCLIDAGAGLNKDRYEDKNTTVIELNGVKIKAMMGIPYLSYFLNIPLIPLFSYRNSNDNFIKVEKAIEIGNVKDRFDFSHKATHILWKKFEKYLNKYPTQWETLYYIHNYYPIDNTEEKVLNNSQTTKYKFNDKLYDFIKIKNEFYLYNYDNLKSFLISEYLYTFLYKIFKYEYILNRKELEIFIKNKSILNQFFNEEILIAI
jgi:lauroyl/myristoyl acyltransferase